MARTSILAMVTLALASLPSLSGCNDDTDESVLEPTPPTAAQLVEQRLFDAMKADDYGAAGDIVADLGELRETVPDDDRNTFVHAAANLWWIAEADRAADGEEPNIGLAIGAIQDSFGIVIEHGGPDTAAATGFLGTFLADSRIDFDRGADLVDESAVDAPEFGLFLTMFIRRYAPAADPLTEEAVAAGFALFDTCAGATIDRDDPDFSAYVAPPTTDARKRFCFGSERVRHGYEGAWLLFGDILVKSGRTGAAHRAYENAMLGANYASWPHKPALEERLGADLEDRAASYEDPDPANWAPVGDPPAGCTLCHATL
jgi:hypothetical protein